MSEPTLADMRNDLTSLRREMDALRARLSASPAAQDEPDIGQIMRRNLKQNLAEKGKASGMSIGSLINQVRAHGGEGTALSIVNLAEAADLPTDEQITEKIARLSLFVQNPLILRALRCLAEPHFDNENKRRTKSDLAASLGVGEAEVEAALTPMLDRYEVTWGKDASGQEYYDWTGSTFVMTLLIMG